MAGSSTVSGQCQLACMLSSAPTRTFHGFNVYRATIDRSLTFVAGFERVQWVSVLFQTANKRGVCAGGTLRLGYVHCTNETMYYYSSKE